VDCEKFDRVVLDLLYDELDEITSASSKRHTEHCTRCRDILAKLRATREVGALPLLDPPEGLELKILLAERRARRELPARQRFGRAISVLAGYAMRPQLAMAALLLLVIGSSLVLLRAQPGEQKSLLVTERGVPEGEPETIAVVPLGEPRKVERPASGESRERRAEARGEDRAPANAPLSAPSKGAAAAIGESVEEGESAAADRATDSDRAYAEALTAYRDRRYEQAEQRFSEVAERGGENAASAALYSAQAARARAGCPTAAPLFEAVAQRYPDSQPGKEAIWQAAGCYRTLGDFERARREYEALLKTPGYADRAQAALASLGDSEPAELATRRAAPMPAAKTAGSAAPLGSGSERRPPLAPTP
jgi:tetratricopeptide (TPR) repeat protein